MSVFLNNRYRIFQTLGSGGCGETFLAEDTHMPSGRRSVIKRLKPATNDPLIYRIIQERFQREAAILEMLGGACDQIPALYAYFTEAQEFYLVQEWVDGQNLAQRLKESGLFSERDVKSLLLNLLPVLDYIHSQGIIHRDIKPENIMLRENDGKPVLIDFGAVKEIVAAAVDAHGAPASSIVIGSPGFMPLEQAAGKPMFASDLYSLGLTAICLLTGKRPHELTDHSSGAVFWHKYAANVSNGLAAILEKAINPFADQRYQTAREMLEALQSTDTASDLTILQRGAQYHAAHSRTTPLSTPANAITQDRVHPHSNRDKSRSHFSYGITLLLAVLLTVVTLALFYDIRIDDSLKSRTVKVKASQPIRDTIISNENTRNMPSAAQVMQPGNFEILNTSDGFTSVRAAPTTKSAEIGRLYPGTRIACESIVKGESLRRTDEWRYCPSVGGYIHSKLLILTQKSKTQEPSQNVSALAQSEPVGL